MRPLSKSINLAATALASVIALTACGGGDSSTPAPSSSPSPVVSQGVITAKGSVFVNGIKFETAGVPVTIDDAPGVEGDLQIGMIVKVTGISDDVAGTGTASKIEATDALEGTITNVGLPGTPGANTITVMGQTVEIEDNVTRLNDDATNPLKTFAAANFAVGERVEVHAFADDQGGLRATRVVKTNRTGDVEVKGFVVGPVTGTFGLSLTPGGASLLTVTGTLPAGAVAGSFVEVRSNAAPVAGAITATTVQLEDNKLGAAGAKVEVEGIVMTGGTSASFTINGQKVITNAATLFEGGLKAELVPGVKVEAEGPLDANGAIVAVKVSFRSNIRIEGVASNVSATGLTLLGQTIAINKYTRMDGIISGQVEVRAMFDRDGKLVATRVVNRGNVDGKAFLQGPVTAFNAAAGTMTILGVPITTGTIFRISTDSSEVGINKDMFFAKVKINTVVKVKWDPFTVLTAPVKEAEIELGKL